MMSGREGSSLSRDRQLHACRLGRPLNKMSRCWALTGARIVLHVSDVRPDISCACACKACRTSGLNKRISAGGPNATLHGLSGTDNVHGSLMGGTPGRCCGWNHDEHCSSCRAITTEASALAQRPAAELERPHQVRRWSSPTARAACQAIKRTHQPV